MLATGWGSGNVWIHLLKLLRWWSTPMRGFACWKRKGLLYILNTALKNTVLMSGVPYGAAVSRASGSFQGRAKHYFPNMLCGTMAQNNRGTSAFLPQVWKRERMTLVWWHQRAIWCLMTSTDWGGESAVKQKNCYRHGHNSLISFFALMLSHCAHLGWSPEL